MKIAHIHKVCCPIKKIWSERKKWEKEIILSDQEFKYLFNEILHQDFMSDGIKLLSEYILKENLQENPNATDNYFFSL